jgi:hypothetical protein
MATPQTRPQFSPEVEARRARKAERAERAKAVAADALDLGRGWSGPTNASRVMDGGAELAVRRASAAVAQGQPLRPAQRRQLRHEFEQRPGGQPAGQRKPNTRARLEAMTPAERDAVERTLTDPEVADYVARIRDEVEDAEELAEYMLATEREEAALANIDDGEDVEWESLGAADAGGAAETYSELEATYDFGEEAE